MKISLVTVTFNSAKTLCDTIHSVLSQSYTDIEYIIVDGLSNDETVTLIKEYEPLFQGRLKWISEKDKGLYDAMNKGLYMATGEYILFFNDIFTQKSSVAKLVWAANSNVNCIGAHSDLVYCSEGKIKRYWRMGEGKIDSGWMPAHPTLLLKKEVYSKYGGYKSGYRCSADYEFMVRILRDKNNMLAYVPETLVSMFYGGTSSSGIRAYGISFKESYKALKENSIAHPLLVCIKRAVKVIKQFVFWGN
mgnify:CR=1 FL=1